MNKLELVNVMTMNLKNELQAVNKDLKALSKKVD